MNARTIIASALGVEPGTPSHCAVCGSSPFDSAGPAHRVLGTNFTDQEQLMDARAGDVCAGCQRILSGRPGADPPPVRMTSFLIDAESMQMTTLDMQAWWSLIDTSHSLPEAAVLSWATSKKRHHWLHARLSTPRQWAAGSDTGTIDWEPEPRLAEAILDLRAIRATKGAILAGRYPVRLHAEHRDVVERAESVLGPYRGRLILDLAVWAAPKADAPASPETGDVTMIDQADERAARMLATLVWGSQMRAEDGQNFWGGYLVRRMRRFARLPLASFTSRLIQECRVGVSSAREASSILAELDEQSTEEIEHAVRDRTDLVHALAFDRIQTMRAERKDATK